MPDALKQAYVLVAAASIAATLFLFLFRRKDIRALLPRFLSYSLVTAAFVWLVWDQNLTWQNHLQTGIFAIAIGLGLWMRFRTGGRMFPMAALFVVAAVFLAAFRVSGKIVRMMGGQQSWFTRPLVMLGLLGLAWCLTRVALYLFSRKSGIAE